MLPEMSWGGRSRSKNRIWSDRGGDEYKYGNGDGDKDGDGAIKKTMAGEYYHASNLFKYK